MQTLDGVLKKKTGEENKKKAEKIYLKQHRDQHARNINIPTDRGILGDEAGLSHAAEVLGRTGTAQVTYKL